MYFNKSETGETYIGYHVEGGESFAFRGCAPLSMKSLTDSTLLFMCNNASEWFPFYLDDCCDNHVVYEIEFSPPKGILMCDHQIFTRSTLLSPFTRNYQFTPDIPKYVDLMIAPGTEEHSEMPSRAALRNPTKYVKSIKRTTVVPPVER